MNRRGFFGTLVAIAAGIGLPKPKPHTGDIALLTSAEPNWQSMDSGIFLGDVSFKYSNAGALTWRGSSRAR